MKLEDYIGEATSYDKKLMLERKDPTSWLKSVSAFANMQGGKLLFGVANDGALCGLADAQDDSEFISETIKMQMDPVPEIDLSIHEEDGKRFVVVMERRGSGFKKILDAYAFESEKRGEVVTPRFESTSTDFFLILPNLNYGRVINGVGSSSEGLKAETTQDATQKTTQEAGSRVNEKVNERQKKIISVISSNPYVTQSGLADILGISLVHVNKNMKKLQALGVIRRVGPDKGGHWEVISKA